MRAGFGELAAGAGELETRLSEAALKLRAALWLENKTGLSILGSPSPAAPKAKGENPRGKQVDDLLHAAEGAGKIGAGTKRARRELGTILDDPVGKEALDRLLLDRGTIADHPEIQRSFDRYLTPDGHHARIDLEQNDRVFSVGAMDNVVNLRRRDPGVPRRERWPARDVSDRRFRRRIGRRPRLDTRRLDPLLVRHSERRVPRSSRRLTRPARVR